MADGSGSITLDWGDEQYTFRLATPQWRKIEDPQACNAGGIVIARRLLAAVTVLQQGVDLRRAIVLGLIAESPRIDDIRAPILWGLVGGGKSEVEAARLVRERVDGRPWTDFGNLSLAYAIVMAGICGPEDDPVEIDDPGETAGEEAAEPLSQTEGTAGPA